MIAILLYLIGLVSAVVTLVVVGFEVPAIYTALMAAYNSGLPNVLPALGGPGAAQPTAAKEAELGAHALSRRPAADGICPHHDPAGLDQPRAARSGVGPEKKRAAPNGAAQFVRETTAISAVCARHVRSPRGMALRFRSRG